MANKALITPFEAVKYSPAGRDYPAATMCVLIPQIEQEFGYECLGKEMYEWLQDNLATVPAGVEEWSCERAYDEGDLAIRNGCTMVSLTDANIDDPVSSENWEAYKRFGDNDCANEMWEDYLRGILANKLFSTSLTYATLRTGAGGLVVLAGTDGFNSQGFKSAGKTEIHDMKTALNADVDRMVRNMLRWAKAKTDSGATCEVPLTSMLNCNGLCKPASNSKRRWGFQY